MINPKILDLFEDYVIGSIGHKGITYLNRDDVRWVLRMAGYVDAADLLDYFDEPTEVPPPSRRRWRRSTII